MAYFGPGKSFNAIFSILIRGFRSATGCFIENKPGTYCTPSIEYAAMYSGPYFDNKLGKWVSLVIQVKVNPAKIIKRERHTLPGLFKGDPNFDGKYNKEYEWILDGKTKVRKDYQ